MKYLREYRDFKAARRYAQTIRRVTTHNWTIMEACGGQTHSIVRYSLDELLPKQIKIAHGTGCPFCVTPVGLIDKAIELSKRKNTMVCVFGDLMRIPGTDSDLLQSRASGGGVRIVFSPLQALDYARQNPDIEVVFFAVGFETTAPANAMSVYLAREQGVKNFSVLVSHVLVPPAMQRIMTMEERHVHGFLANGHACTVMGYREYEDLCEKFKAPIIITGFEPLDILQAILMCVIQLEEGRSEVENQYSRTVDRIGNLHARKMLEDVFEVVTYHWRDMDTMPASGLGLRDEFREFDAEARFGTVDHERDGEPNGCISASIHRGESRPIECPAFGTLCTPEHPLGAPMVSSEGICSAYYRYRRPQK